MLEGNRLALPLALALVFLFGSFRFSETRVPKDEVDALQKMASTMGARYWQFDADSCKLELVGLTRNPPRDSEKSLDCECHLEASRNVCHVVRIVLKRFDLPGVLPPELVKLPYLREIDFAYNYLNGTIPTEWASTNLTSISVLGNRLSGEIPKELGELMNLTYLCLEANQFTGSVPFEIGNLINLTTLMLSSNQFNGTLPPSLKGLINLTDFRINDNNFNGAIPDFIQNWRQLTRLEMQGSGLSGPIPSNVSLLVKLTDLRISDISGASQKFPMLDNIRGLLRLVLRNCNISGEIPAYIWDYDYLQLLDTSFNQLGGGFPNYVRGKNLKFIFLSGNLLSGTIPDSLLKRGGSIDLSYNNFTWQGPEHSACQENMNRNVNLFRSSMENNLKGVLPCSKNADCPKYGCSFHVNCGGPDLTLKDRDVKAVYEGDLTVEGGTAKYYLSNNYWGFSSTGDFMDDNDFQNKLYTTSFSSREVPELYTTARLSPLSLTYFRYCLEDGNYSVNLHFAEIQFTNDGTYNSLGRRFFDIYIQGNLVWKDFNIEDAAHGAQKPVIKEFSANVTNSILEIRFDWAGKGTTRIPYAGSYGPLVSAISVLPSSRTCSEVGKKRTGTVFIILGSVVLALVLVILVFLWWKRLKRSRQEKDFERLDLQTGSFSLKQIKAATNNFDSGNKIGEGGFGPVFKGLLPDGTTIAVKQLSSKSRQGNREFLNEIGMISCLQHPNLVKLHGCCIEEEQLLLVYEYMENNSLARALFGRENSRLKLDWQTRLTITIGIAKGLAFLHEESRFKIVHRDIKATNVLLDGHLNPKISDFGLARLDEEEKTHISTRVAGTVGYMAPEYALWGYLTYKADVYSFGVMVLEIVSGKSNSSYMPSNDYICLLDWAFDVHRSGNLMELVDEKLGSEVDTAEAERVVKVSLLCTNATPSVRPTMSEVVSMLEGTVPVPDVIPESSSFSEDLRFKSMKDFHQQRQSEASSQTLISASAMTRTETGSSQASTSDLYEINLQ